MKNISKKAIIILIILLIIDQASKIWIKTNMSLGESIMVFSDWFQIKFIENRGAAYGMELGGDFGKLALSLIRIFLIGFLFYYIKKLINQRAKFGIVLGLLLILAGAIGNLIDCVFYGVIFSESTAWQVATMFPAGGGYETWLHGNVVDMLYFPIIDTILPEWVPMYGGEQYIFFSPIFNLADSYISIGFAYLLIFHRKDF